MSNRVSEEFPLTRRWTKLIIKIANSRKMGIDESLHESTILEWELSQKIPDFIWRENYFKKCLYNRLYDSSRNWWVNCRFIDSTPGHDILDEIITMRSFNELYYEDMVKHVCSILAKIDKLGRELFILRVQEGLKWKDIKDRYPQIAHTRFYNSVKRIKGVVKKEICSV